MLEEAFMVTCIPKSHVDWLQLHLRRIRVHLLWNPSDIHINRIRDVWIIRYFVSRSMDGKEYGGFPHSQLPPPFSWNLPITWAELRLPFNCSMTRPLNPHHRFVAANSYQNKSLASWPHRFKTSPVASAPPVWLGSYSLAWDCLENEVLLLWAIIFISFALP
jgi:hypothetical protein